MVSKFRIAAFSMILLTGILTLGACDSPEDETAGVSEAAPQSGEPVATPAAQGGSMAEDSPAGAGVTAEEIPQSDVPPPSREVFTDAACDFEGWVGRQVDEGAVKETGRPFRILKPDSMMTMDHNPDRINVVHDEDMTVTRVWCG